MTDSNRHAPSSATDRANRSSATRGPYAGPARGAVDRVVQADRTAVRPYVPAPFRGKPALDRTIPESEGLPSIDRFLSTPSGDNPSVLATNAAPSQDVTSSSALEGQWPLEEAGAELQRIGDLFDEPQGEPPALFAGALDEPGVDNAGAPVSSKPMWRTDEWMDIMPVAPLESSEQRESGQGDNTEARRAADALEAIVQRVRDGEIEIPGYHETMTDAALLATVLTAMLGRGR